MSAQQQLEAERLEADLRVQEQANVERYRLEQHLARIEAAREVSPPGSRSVSPPPRPLTPAPVRDTSEVRSSPSGDNTESSELHSVPSVSESSPQSWLGRVFLLTLNVVERWPRLFEYLQTRNIAYLYAGFEKAPTTGHEHIHVFVMYTCRVRLSKVNLEGARVDIVTKTWWNALQYVKKGEKVAEKGTEPIRSVVPKGLTIKDVMEMDEAQLVDLKASSFNYVRNIRSELLNTQLRKNRHAAPIEFEWIYGPTGSGKSRKAFEEGATPIQYTNGFFTDWAGSKVLVLEEFRGEIPYRLMLELTDRYHGYYALNIKGGFRVLDIDKLIVTSPYRPEECYKQQVQKTDSIQQLMRRITKLVRMDGDGVELEEDPGEIRVPELPDFSVQNEIVRSNFH